MKKKEFELRSKKVGWIDKHGLHKHTISINSQSVS